MVLFLLLESEVGADVSKLPTLKRRHRLGPACGPRLTGATNLEPSLKNGSDLFQPWLGVPICSSRRARRCARARGRLFPGKQGYLLALRRQPVAPTRARGTHGMGTGTIRCAGRGLETEQRQSPPPLAERQQTPPHLPAPNRRRSWHGFVHRRMTLGLQSTLQPSRTRQA